MFSFSFQLKATLKKLLDTLYMYPNKKGLNRPKTISRYCAFKDTVRVEHLRNMHIFWKFLGSNFLQCAK